MRMNSQSLVYSTICLLFLFASETKANNYVCDSDTDYIFIAEAIKVSDKCCADGHDLHEMKFGQLEKELEKCASNLALNMAETEETNCNDAKTECSYNYDTFGCTDHMIDLCRQTGGKEVEVDVSLTCNNKNTTILNLLHCVGLSCTPADITSMYEAIVKMKVGDESRGCSAPVIENMRITENPPVKNPKIEAEKQKEIEAEAAIPKEPLLKTWEIVAIVFGSLAAAVISMRIKARRARKKRRTRKALAIARGIPIIKGWRLREDGGISGFIYNSKHYEDGDAVETSRITNGKIKKDSFVATKSGSKYFLSSEKPKFKPPQTSLPEVA